MRYALRHMGLTGAMLVIAAPALAAGSPSDPLNSVMWDILRDQYFAGAPVVFDNAVKVTAPAAAEDTRAVPLSVDATALGQVVEMVAIADLNPFPLVLRYHPGTAAAYIATRIKIQQATAVRGAARTTDGVWHVSGVMVDAAGGGCSAPPVSYAEKGWADHVGEVQARLWPTGEDGVARLRLRIRHPNDTGLVDGIPAYFVETLQVDAQTPGGSATLARIDSLEPVSENPVYSLDLRPPPDAAALILHGRDNQGGEIRATIPMPSRGAKPAMSLRPPAHQSWSIGQ